MEDYIIQAKDLDELKSAAKEILNHFPKNKIFTLNGDLGAGKTALVKAFCEVLNISETVSSPTFSLVHEYKGEETVYHFDLYRLNKTEDLLQIGFEEYLYADAYVFIEWPEIAFPILPEEFVEITITIGEQFTRKIACTSVKNT